MEAQKDELCVSNYVISQPTLEQVFLSFVNEDKVGLSASTIESAIESAFDEEDVRRARASKPKCCGCERKTHRRNVFYGCPMCVLFGILFSFFVLMDKLAWFLNGFDKAGQYVESVYPLNELLFEPVCRTDLDDDALSKFDAFTAPSATTASRIDDDERAKTYGFETLTRNVIFPQETKWEMYCGAIVIPFSWNKNWKIQNMNLSVGISGDFDGSCTTGKHKSGPAYVEEFSCQWESEENANLHSEWFNVGVVRHNSTKIRNPYFDGKMYGNYPKWGRKKEIRGRYANSFRDWEDDWRNWLYWYWGYQMDEWWWRENMLEDYNKEFEYEEVGYCKPDGDDNQASTEYYDMWTGWKMDAYDTYSHDNGACAANYWGNPTWGKEKFTEDRHHNRHRGDSCSNVEDKYEAECEYGLVMNGYDGYDWHTVALWYKETYGEKASYTYEYEYRVCGCEKASLASGDCSANFKSYAGSCYYIPSTSYWKTFAECSTMCREFNATMPCIESQAENDYISALRPKEGESGIPGEINENLQGRCTMDCDNNPTYETCVEDMQLVQDETKFYWDGRDEMPADISLLLMPGRGANIDSCDSGLMAQVVLTIQYTCDAATPQPSPEPTPVPSLVPTMVPSEPTIVPSPSPSALPTMVPTSVPTSVPPVPTLVLVPSLIPTQPSPLPSLEPSPLPSLAPSPVPTITSVPTAKPSLRPTPEPTSALDCSTLLPLTDTVYANVSKDFCVSQRFFRRWPGTWVWWFVGLWWMGGTFILMMTCIIGIFGMCCTKRSEEEEAGGRKAKGKMCFGAC